MKMNKFDMIQLAFNFLLITATIMNVLVILGVCARLYSYIGFVLAIGGCVMANTATGGRQQGQRQTVRGNPILAGLTYVTGAAWLLSFAVIQFNIVNINVGGGV